VSPRQPVVSGEHLVKALAKDGWAVVRRRGSHVRLKEAWASDGPRRAAPQGAPKGHARWNPARRGPQLRGRSAPALGSRGLGQEARAQEEGRRLRSERCRNCETEGGGDPQRGKGDREHETEGSEAEEARPQRNMQKIWRGRLRCALSRRAGSSHSILIRSL
jgi:HicA toxin of bacterial toxin-antitoxin,